MIGVYINPVLQQHLVTNGYTEIDITPLYGYDDSVVPFITWDESVATRSVEQYWLRESILTYYVFDTNLSRAKDIAKLIDTFLNIGDEVNTLKALFTTPDYRLCWSRLAGGEMYPAIERDGFASVTRNFEVGYVEV
jgi:hypothetical protein